MGKTVMLDQKLHREAAISAAKQYMTVGKYVTALVSRAIELGLDEGMWLKLKAVGEKNGLNISQVLNFLLEEHK